MTESHKGRNLAIVFGIIVLLVAFTFAVPIFAVTYQEAYDVEVPYEVLEEYTVQVPYTVEVTVVRTETVYSRQNRVLDSGIYTGEFSLTSSRIISISWSSTNNLIFVSVMKTSTWNKLYAALVIEFGLSVIATVLTGGALGPALAAALPTFLITTATTIMTSDDYYKINSQYDSALKSVPSEIYKVTVINSNQDNVINFSISYDYETKELQTQYREETRYRTVTNYRTETRYRTIELKVTLWELITGTYRR